MKFKIIYLIHPWFSRNKLKHALICIILYCYKCTFNVMCIGGLSHSKTIRFFVIFSSKFVCNFFCLFQKVVIKEVISRFIRKLAFKYICDDNTYRRLVHAICVTSACHSKPCLMFRDSAHLF